MPSAPRIAVVIPCYRCKDQILGVIQKIDATVSEIIVVDDACPDQTGAWVQNQNKDSRVQVTFHTTNRGVGGALITGYQKALQLKADVIVKIDGDGQMDPGHLSKITGPLIRGTADYSKGNRFFYPKSLQGMPLIRVIGNAGLSFMAKLATGYWNLMDPTNGYTAIHAQALRLIELDKLDQRYFFETDMLFRLSLIQAVVRDVPMDSHYADEKSNLRIGKILFEFTFKYLRAFFKRVIYQYFLRDFNIGSLELIAGILFLSFGIGFGSYHWITGKQLGQLATSGTVMLAALPIILGAQFILSAINYDISKTPTTPLQELGSGKPL